MTRWIEFWRIDFSKNGKMFTEHRLKKISENR